MADPLDVDKIKERLSTISNGAKAYRAKVKELKEKKLAQETEPDPFNFPSTSLNGNTSPSG